MSSAKKNLTTLKRIFLFLFKKLLRRIGQANSVLQKSISFCYFYWQIPNLYSIELFNCFSTKCLSHDSLKMEKLHDYLMLEFLPHNVLFETIFFKNFLPLRQTVWLPQIELFHQILFQAVTVECCIHMASTTCIL